MVVVCCFCVCVCVFCGGKKKVQLQGIMCYIFTTCENGCYFFFFFSCCTSVFKMMFYIKSSDHPLIKDIGQDTLTKSKCSTICSFCKWHFMLINRSFKNINVTEQLGYKCKWSLIAWVNTLTLILSVLNSQKLECL